MSEFRKTIKAGDAMVSVASGDSGVVRLYIHLDGGFASVRLNAGDAEELAHHVRAAKGVAEGAAVACEACGERFDFDCAACDGEGVICASRGESDTQTWRKDPAMKRAAEKLLGGES